VTVLSIKKLNESGYGKKQGKKIQRELPYFITIITLLAESGLGPYNICQKIKDIVDLPIVRLEAIKILKRIDMLGTDPLTALAQAKDRPSSKALGEFLSGYVSAIQSGGNVISYLKSKMTSAYEMLQNEEKQSTEKLSGLVHAYLTMQVVMLAVFILLSALGTTPLEGYMASPVTAVPSPPPYVMLAFPVIMTAVFLIMANKIIHSNIQEIEMKKILRFALPPVLVGVVLIFSNLFSGLQANAYILGMSLIAASIWPALKFKKIYTTNIDAEEATPQILRDITEARKAGIYPEKCIIHACKRADYKTFTPIANSIASKLEWGIPINDIFGTIKNEINNFQVLVIFRILFVVIFSGGGNVNTLDTLANTSERIYNIEKNKRDMLKPYIVVGFMIVVLTGLTSLLTIDAFSEINQQKKIGQINPDVAESDALMQAVSASVIIQAWLAGLFIGKITRGVYSGGFIFSIFFTAITILAIAIVQLQIINIGTIFIAS
jgi:flagellar protein FlaJ